jgi:DNA-binding transcriptional MerR regulator
MEARYVTSADAAKALGVSQTTLNRWARRGLIKPAYTTPGGQRRWDVDKLRKQLDFEDED